MQSQHPQWGESKAGGSTLLAQLGFADKDRASPRHDLAVAFAGSMARHFAEMLTPSDHQIWLEEHDFGWGTAPVLKAESRVCRPDVRNLRRPPTPSSFLVGFADGVLGWTYCRLQPGEFYALARARKTTRRDQPVMGSAIVEVKITRCSASDVVRQIEAYRGGITAEGTSLARAPALLLVDFDICSAEYDLLKAHEIITMRLGPAFEAFARVHNQPVTLPSL